MQEVIERLFAILLIFDELFATWEASEELVIGSNFVSCSVLV